jgi:hypothetical protein
MNSGKSREMHQTLQNHFVYSEIKRITEGQVSTFSKLSQAQWRFFNKMGWIVFLQRAVLVVIAAVTLVQHAYGETGIESDASKEWFGHMSTAGSVKHFNDEGAPYRLSIGAGHLAFSNDLSFMASVAYSYYDVNAVADNNPTPDLRGGNSHSLGFDLLMRWSFLQTLPVSCHIDGGAGFQSMLTDPPFPADGSKENFTLLFGPGVLIPTDIDNRLRVSLLWFHISNANLFPKNSGYDGLQLVVGFEWTL